jgi:hypothetical protein
MELLPPGKPANDPSAQTASAAVVRFWHDTLETRGQFGDMFGAVTSFFTALGFAEVAYTLHLQRIQLGHQAAGDARQSGASGASK